MTPLRIAFCALVAASSCAACTPELTPEEVEGKLKAATASALAVDPSTVTIMEPQATQTRRIWRAETGGRVFACDADRSFAVPDCSPVLSVGAAR
jgi:hypothetical protein